MFDSNHQVACLCSRLLSDKCCRRQHKQCSAPNQPMCQFKLCGFVLYRNVQNDGSDVIRIRQKHLHSDMMTSGRLIKRENQDSCVDDEKKKLNHILSLK